MVAKKKNISKKIEKKLKKIKMLITDCDGVLTDGSVYYSEKGEEMLKFSRRDGMGIERLRKFAEIETGIITSEYSEIVKKRAEKLEITDIFSGALDKKLILGKILEAKKIKKENIAYIGDDLNDLEIIKLAGLSACPSDAFPEIRKNVDYICENKGGFGAFREFAELIISSKINNKRIKNAKPKKN